MKFLSSGDWKNKDFHEILNAFTEYLRLIDNVAENFTQSEKFVCRFHEFFSIKCINLTTYYKLY